MDWLVFRIMSYAYGKHKKLVNIFKNAMSFCKAKKYFFKKDYQ